MRSVGRIFALALMAASFCATASAQGTIPLIDSYTVDQRYSKNKPDYPEISWPTLSFEAGQTISFDRLCKEDESRKLHVDVFEPIEDARNGKAVILVHGGAWRSGNKSHMFPLANLLAQRGYTVFTPEYRLSAEAAYPTGMTDLSDLVVWVKSSAEEFGVEPEAVAIAGGSSGGHMAALLAYAAHEPLYKSDPAQNTSLAAVIDMDGVLDFETELALKYEDYGKEKSGVALWVGGSYEQATDIWGELSPVNHLSEQSPPTLVISSGNERFTEGHEEVEAVLARHGIPYEFFSYEGLFHTFWLFDPYLTETADRIDGFLQRVMPAE